MQSYAEYIARLQKKARWTKGHDCPEFWDVRAQAMKVATEVVLSGEHCISEEFDVVAFASYNNVEGWTPCAFGGSRVLAYDPSVEGWKLFVSEEYDGRLWL